MFCTFQQVLNRFVLTACCLFASQAYCAQAGTITTEVWLKQAQAMRLAEHPGWLALLHYNTGVFTPQPASQADGAAFFLHTEGASDAEAELRADIESFFAPYGADHAQCLFPARWWWLKQQLSIPDDYDVRCPLLDAFMQRIASDRLYLVFPSMYLNNPGSTFGHTFLRFDDADGAVLLSQTLNYSARVGEHDNFISYVSKGLLGGYQGYFRARPYFEMVQEYSNIENRDIREYRLDFSADEITQLIRHVWEVKDISFDYYFLRENCAFRLLALLEAVRPELELTGRGRFPVYAIPVDTVRAMDEEGLIIDRHFRPSLATSIDTAADKLGDDFDLVVQVLSAVNGPEAIHAVISETDDKAVQLEVLDTSYAILEFGQQAASARAQDVLAVLNSLPADGTTPERGYLAQDYLEPDYSDRLSPEKGHSSARIAVGYGEQNDLSYVNLRFRPGFHDLLDALPGFIEGASINVLAGRAKWFEQQDSLRLETLSLVNVTSLSPVSPWRRPLSWQFDFRFDRTRLDTDEPVKNFTSEGAAGISARSGVLMPYLMAAAEWQLARDYYKGHSIMLGMKSGVYIYPGNMPAQLQLEYERTEAVSGFELGYEAATINWQIDIAVNHALRMQYRLQRYDFFDDEDWVVDYNFYF